jgi:hypothetical protein
MAEETCMSTELKPAIANWFMNSSELFVDVGIHEATPEQFRTNYGPIDCDNCTWMKQLSHPNVSDPTTKEDRLFRRRFAVPHEIFVRLSEEANIWFPISKHGSGIAPMDLKVLGVLRVLEKGCSFDAISELTNLSEDTHRKFHHKYLSRFVLEKRSRWIRYPRNKKEAINILHVYKKLGVPGSVGSIDVTHIPWGRCPQSLQSKFTGKEGYPTVAFEVTVDHHNRIFFCTNGHPGTRNDKTICRFDEYLMALHQGKILSDVEFILSGNGTDTSHRGGYLICDGGYHLWRIFQAPIKCAFDDKDCLWSCRLESIRKDVECTFGILKKRFQCLAGACLYKDRVQVDN